MSTNHKSKIECTQKGIVNSYSCILSVSNYELYLIGGNYFGPNKDVYHITITKDNQIEFISKP